MDEGVAITVVPVETPEKGAHPEYSTAVDEKGKDMIVSKAGRNHRIVTDDREMISVVPVEAVLGREPHESLVVLRDRVDDRLGETRIDR
jgi:hypothetical protein